MTGSIRGVLIAMTLLTAPALAQPTDAPAPAPEEYSGVTIRRPSLMVRDMDRALALYRDILGLRLGRRYFDAPDSYVYPAFNVPRGTRVEHATLDAGQNVRALSLVAVASMPRPPRREGLRTSAILINANGRLQEILRRLTAGGYRTMPCQPMKPAGTECAFLDADGHLISLYEIPD